MSLYGGITLPGAPNLENVRRLDCAILPALNRYSRIGIAIDIPYLRELSAQFDHEAKALEKDIFSYVPSHALNQFVASAARIDSEAEEADETIEFNAASADQIRTLVFDLLDVGRNQKLKSTASGKVSTGRKNLDLVRDQHPVIPLVIQYRERAKLRSAFCESLPKLARLHPRSSCCSICELSHVEATWRLHTTFATTRAITGRLSSRRPNLQQIPIRSDLGARIRAAFVASPGTRLVSVDFSQMEIRDLAHLANARSMIRVYDADGDIHLNTAMESFGISDPAKVDKYKHRLPAKRTNFGIQNGTTGKGLHAQLVSDYWSAAMTPPEWLTEDWCDKFITRWHAAYPEVQPYFDTQYYRARRYKFVWNPWGRVRYIPQVMSSLPWKVSEGLREAQNFPVTSSNAEQTKLAMVECEGSFERCREGAMHCEGLLSIHDQVIAEVDEEYAEAVGTEIVSIFESVMNDRSTGERLWRVPIRADCEILERWKAKE
jgi:DNA polymerase-1